MRRLLFTLLMAVVFLVPVSIAGAEVSTLIGKRVEGVLPIIVGDEEIEAIVINGTSYAPVRAVVEMVGGEVNFVGGKVFVTPPEVERVPGKTEINPIAVENERLIEEGKRRLEEQMNPTLSKEQQIKNIQDRLSLLEVIIIQHETFRDERGIFDYDQMIIDWKVEKADLEAQLAALEAE